GDWGKAPFEFAYQPTVLFDNQSGIGPVMGRVRDAERLPDDTIDGKAVYHVRARVDDKVIAPLTYSTIKGSPVTVDLWIDQATDDLLRAVLAESPAPDRPHPATWTLDLSHHGDKVSIEPPV
ncbi:MAG TPA: LppX_LprAFG lipoprotein, partial [Thermomicrobiales bacterium]|nr:LppX_LprAFG lipoprotein [Thermomicrobiales bacterium]